MTITVTLDTRLVRLQEVINSFRPSLFSSAAQPYGRARQFCHCIRTVTEQPVSLRARPTSPQEREIVKAEVAKMLASGAIRPSHSSWSSPIVLVPKKDASTRFCVDYRKVNDLTIKDVYPLPRTSDMLESLHGKRYFTTLDAASGYWQIPMEAASIAKTAFSCSEGFFEYVVMPFGLCNAPATYQRAMDTLFSDLLWKTVLVYIDDIIIMSESWDQHCKDVKIVLQRIHDAGLLLKLEKCKFGVTSVEYLGHIISREGLHPDPKKIQRLKDWAIPRTVNEVRSFLGFANYYRRFVRDFAKVAEPLTRLLKADATWIWEREQETAFVTLLTTLRNEAVLSHPDFNHPFLVDADASDQGIAAVLSQRVDNVEKPIIFESRILSPAERKWHIREKEALAVIWALEVFRRFILGREFLVRTDHSSLQWLLQAPSGRLARWAIKISEFGPFPIEHRRGSTHANVDAFTRLKSASECFPDVAFPTYSLLPAGFPRNVAILPTLKTLREEQQADKGCSRLRHLSPAQAECRDGVLGVNTRGRWRPVLPDSLLEDVVKSFHQPEHHAHLGARRTLSKVSQFYTITGGLKKVAYILQRCLPCLRRKTPLQRLGKLSSCPPTSPWRVVATDFCGPYVQTDSGNRYVLVFVDQFTKWVELIACPDQTAVTVCQALYRRIICRHGCPKLLLSDRGPQYKSDLLQIVCEHFGISKIFSSAYYPQGDGYAERFMRTLNNSLSVLSHKFVSQWDDYLDGLACSYNSTDHAATGISPFELNTGRVFILPEGRKSDAWHDPRYQNALQYSKHLRSVLTNLTDKARKTVENYWSRMKKSYDAQRKGIELEIGDQVLVRLPEHERAVFPCRKLAPRWSDVSQIVDYTMSPNTFRVLRPGKNPEEVNISRLLPLRRDVWSEEASVVSVSPNRSSQSESSTEKSRSVMTPEEGSQLEQATVEPGVDNATGESRSATLKSDSTSDSPWVEISTSRSGSPDVEVSSTLTSKDNSSNISAVYLNDRGR